MYNAFIRNKEGYRDAANSVLGDIEEESTQRSSISSLFKKGTGNTSKLNGGSGSTKASKVSPNEL